MKTVAVIGGGITGLSTMYYLQKIKKERNLDVDLILVEKNEELGGKIHTVKNENFIIETGADSIVARHESVMPLIKELQLEEEVVYNSTGISYIYTNDELHAIPADTVFGIPTSIESLFSSTLISTEGKNEALKDLETKNETFTLESSIGSFLEHFLGKEIVDKQIAPVLSGVYSGDLNKLTISSTLPYLLEYKNKYGSIIKGLSENREQFLAAANKKFVSFQNGLSTIIKKLEEDIKDCTVLKAVGTHTVQKQNGKYEIILSNAEVLKADYVVLATPHDVSQSLLKNEQLDHDFDLLKNSSLISIYLGFDINDNELPADGTGFIVSENSSVQCDACTWTSRKWEHTSKKQQLLVRLFYKSSNSAYEELKNMNKEELVKEAMKDIEKSLNLRGKPRHVQVTHWSEQMPNYHLQHNRSVQSLTKKMELHYPNVLLAGCSYFGVGIGACIKNGKETAERIARDL